MSKIEEMAEKAYPDFPFIDGKSGRRMMMSDSNMRNAYKNGAIKVLEEIEKVLVAACEQYISKQAVALNTEIYNKIQELKED